MTTNAYTINTKTGETKPVAIVEMTKAFAKVTYTSPAGMEYISGWSKRADGRWFEVGMTRKSEKITELRFR